MAIVKDPEGKEASTLHAMLNVQGMRVLEVGCGEGRLTWKYASSTTWVTGIDPDEQALASAKANMPGELVGRASFHATSLEDFARTHSGHRFDLAIFPWSL